MKEHFKAPQVIISLDEYEYLKETIKELTLEVEELRSKIEFCGNTSVTYDSLPVYKSDILSIFPNINRQL